MRSIAIRLGVLLLAVLLAGGLLVAFLAGCGGGGSKAQEMSIEEVWAKAGDTDKKVNSEHMEIAIYYENTPYGSGQTQSIILDINGNDVHLQKLLFGNVYSEYIRVKGKQYSKEAGQGTWTQVTTAPPDNSASQVGSDFLQLPSLADSQERVGTEMLGDVETEHYHFSLSPQAAINMFPSTPPSDFSSTTGGEVDVWIRSNDFNMVRYELVIKNVHITDEIDNGDIKFIVNVRDINKPIEIKAPM